MYPSVSSSSSVWVSSVSDVSNFELVSHLLSSRKSQSSFKLKLKCGPTAIMFGFGWNHIMDFLPSRKGERQKECGNKISDDRMLFYQK